MQKLFPNNEKMKNKCKCTIVCDNQIIEKKGSDSSNQNIKIQQM